MELTHFVSLGIILGCCFSHVSPSDIKSYYLEEICNRNNPQSAILKVGPTSSDYSSGILNVTKYNQYLNNYRCVVRLEPPSRHYLFIAFRIIDLRDGCVDSLSIKSNGQRLYYCSNLHDPTETKITLWGEKPTIYFQSATGSINRTGFQLTFTAVRSNDFCEPYEHECDQNATGHFCISKNLMCDGHNHCGNRQEQNDCELVLDAGTTLSAVMGESEWTMPQIVIALLLCLLLVIVISAILGFICNKKCHSDKNARNKRSRADKIDVTSKEQGIGLIEHPTSKRDNQQSQSPGSPSCAPQGNPSFSPQGNPSFSPQGNPSFSPQGNPAFSPQGNPAFSPQGIPTFSPQGSSPFSPQGNPTFSHPFLR